MKARLLAGLILPLFAVHAVSAAPEPVVDQYTITPVSAHGSAATSPPPPPPPPPASCPFSIDNLCAESTQYIAAPQIQDTNFAVTSAGTGQLPGANTTGSSISSNTLTIGAVTGGAIVVGLEVDGTGITPGLCTIASGAGLSWTVTGTCPNVSAEAIKLQPSSAMIAYRTAWLMGNNLKGSTTGYNRAGWQYPVGAGPDNTRSPISSLASRDGCSYTDPGVYSATNAVVAPSGYVVGTNYFGGPYVFCNFPAANVTAATASGNVLTTAVAMPWSGGESIMTLPFQNEAGTASGNTITTANASAWMPGQTICQTNTAIAYYNCVRGGYADVIVSVTGTSVVVAGDAGSPPASGNFASAVLPWLGTVASISGTTVTVTGATSPPAAGLFSDIVFNGYDFTETAATGLTAKDSTCVQTYIGANGAANTAVLFLNTRQKGHLTQVAATATASGGVLTPSVTMYWLPGQTIIETTGSGYSGTIVPNNATGTTVTGACTSSSNCTLTLGTLNSGGYIAAGQGLVGAGLNGSCTVGANITGGQTPGSTWKIAPSSGASCTSASATIVFQSNGQTTWNVTGSPPASGTFQSGTDTCWNGLGLVTTRGAGATPYTWIGGVNHTVDAGAVENSTLPIGVAGLVLGTNQTSWLFDNRQSAGGAPFPNPVFSIFGAYTNLGHIPVRGGSAGTVIWLGNYGRDICMADISNFNACHGEWTELAGGISIRNDNFGSNTFVQDALAANAGLNSVNYFGSGSGNNTFLPAATLINPLDVLNNVGCTNTPDTTDYPPWGYGPINPCTGGGGYGNGVFNFNYASSAGFANIQGIVCDCTASFDPYSNSHNILGSMHATVASTGPVLTVTIPGGGYSNNAANGNAQLNPDILLVDPNTADNFQDTTITSLGTLSNSSALTLGVYPNCVVGTNPGCGTVNLLSTQAEPTSSFPTATVASTVASGKVVTITGSIPAGIISSNCASLQYCAQVIDLTTTAAIPPGNGIASVSGSAITLGGNIAAQVNAGDTLEFLPNYLTYAQFGTLIDTGNYSMGGPFPTRCAYSGTTCSAGSKSLGPAAMDPFPSSVVGVVTTYKWDAVAVP